LEEELLEIFSSVHENNRRGIKYLKQVTQKNFLDRNTVKKGRGKILEITKMQRKFRLKLFDNV
jgi:hypothetical protein